FCWGGLFKRRMIPPARPFLFFEFGIQAPVMAESAAATNRRPALVLCIVALYAAAIYLPFLGSSHVLSEHEGYIATTALRMVDRESWLIPQYGNWNRIEKPPAYNWICAALFRLVGRMSETAERLPAALSAIALCLVVAVVALRFFDQRTALLAGLIQATCVWTYLQGRLGENDMPLTLL